MKKKFLREKVNNYEKDINNLNNINNQIYVLDTKICEYQLLIQKELIWKDYNTFNQNNYDT